MLLYIYANGLNIIFLVQNVDYKNVKVLKGPKILFNLS